MKNWLGFHHHHPIRIRPVKVLLLNRSEVSNIVPRKNPWRQMGFSSNLFYHQQPLIKTIIFISFICLILKHFFHHLTEFGSFKNPTRLEVVESEAWPEVILKLLGADRIRWMDAMITKNFRYLKWRNPEPYVWLFVGVGFPLHKPYIEHFYAFF